MRAKRQGEAIRIRARPLSPGHVDDPEPTAGWLGRASNQNPRARASAANAIFDAGIDDGV